MSNIVSLIPKIFNKQKMECSSNFEKQYCSISIPNNHKRRMFKYFSRITPAKFMKLRELEGFSHEEVLSTLFGKRFGKVFIVYELSYIAGKLKFILLELVKIITKNLLILATYMGNTAEGGETIFYNDFEIYDCKPTRLCVDPLGNC